MQLSGGEMIKKRDIVDRAFKLLSMSGFYLEDSPEDEIDILETLDDMMSEWQGVDYDFGYIVGEDNNSSLDDDSGIKHDALSGIAHKLALRICSVFGKQATPLLMAQTSEAYNALLTRYQTIPESKNHGSTMLFGAGNKRFR